MAKAPSPIFQLKVTLNRTRPPIWRRLEVRGDSPLGQLHLVLQIAMGWTNSHLHQFTIGDQRYGAPEYDDGGDLYPLLPEQRYRLDQVAAQPGARFDYEYDFGDGWDHTVLVEKIKPPEPGATYPRCTAGKRACPPEDIGGVWGYAAFLEAVNNPRHPDHATYAEWYEGEFDAEAFDVAAINGALGRLGRGRRGTVPDEEAGFMLADPWDPDEALQLDAAWADTLAEPERAAVEQLALRRDVVTLLTYLRDQTVTGTASTGNLPLKAVRAIAAQFVEPPPLEATLGDRVVKARSETDVWPLYFRRVLADTAGLIAGGPGRRWRLTERGEQFLAAPPAAQVWLLFATWWTQVDWLLAVPVEFVGEALPEDLRDLTLERLLALPNERIPFVPFANELVGEPDPAEMQNLSPADQQIFRHLIHGLVDLIIVRPLSDFGVLTTERGPRPDLGPNIQVLVAIRLTPTGQALLTALPSAAG